MTSQNPPEGTQTILAEGADIAGAIVTAAAKLGVPKNGVQWTLDKSWFKDASGRVVPRDTVRITAWTRNLEELEAATDAQVWLSGLLERMDFEKSSVEGDVGPNNTVILKIDVDAPSRLVGRRGKTLKAIRHLLMQSVGADYPDRDFRLEVPDNRDDRDDRGRDDSRDRDDRGRDDRGRDDHNQDDRPRDDRPRDDRPRDDRPRDDRPRDDRGRDDRSRGRDDRGRGRDDRGRGRDDRRSRDAQDTKRLERMAQKIAERVLETGESEIIRKELNGYDRRVVHVTVSEIPGVGTRSIGEGTLKQIEIYSESGAPTAREE